MSAGYATSRPAVHPHVIERVRRHLGLDRKVSRALDVGCGAGLSTKPLEEIAECCIGIEPVEAMLAWTRSTAPDAHFLVGAAEAIPIAGRSIDILTAAGSLNYADFDLFFPEAARVLKERGVLVGEFLAMESVEREMAIVGIRVASDTRRFELGGPRPSR